MPSDDDDDRPRRVRPRPDDEDDARPRRKRPRNEDDETADATGGVIPYKNGTALAAYYCAVFSFIPIFGCVLGPVAIVLGVMGILYANKHPKARGMGHAVFGIVGGLVGPFFIAGIATALGVFAGK